MSVYDSLPAMPSGKSDFKPLNVPPSQGYTSAEWNNLCQAITDLRFVARRTNQNVTFSATPAFDASLGEQIRMLLTGNVTSWTLAAGLHGQTVTLMLQQDGTGGRSFGGAPSNVLLQQSQLKLSPGANAVDVIVLMWLSQASKWVEVSRSFATAQAETLDRTIYVSPSGDDANDGSSVGTPVQTIARARALVLKDISADVTIKLAAGTYNETISDSRNFVSDPTTAKASLMFEGDFADFTPATGPTTGTFDASFGSPTIPNTASVAGATWTTDNLAGAFVEMTSGPDIGLRLPIHSNTATTMDMGGPADRTTSSGKDLRGQTFKFVKPSVILNHPLTTTAALALCSGTTNKTAPSAITTPKLRGAYNFYGIAFVAGTSTRQLISAFGNEVRAESCTFDQQQSATLPTVTTVQATKVGGAVRSALCYFTCNPAATNTQVTHFGTGSSQNGGAGTIAFTVFNGGNTAISIGLQTSCTVNSCLAHGQRTVGILVSGGSLSNTGGIVCRNINSTSSASGIRFGSNANSSAFMFTSQPTIGATKIINCGIGILDDGATTFSNTPIRNMIIDGCGVGVWISGSGSQLGFQNSSIINCTLFGVRCGVSPFATSPAFNAGYEASAGGITMTGNAADFTFDGVTTYTKAQIDGAVNKLTVSTDGKNNYFLGS